jgi:hypothetical protein
MSLSRDDIASSACDIIVIRFSCPLPAEGRDGLVDRDRPGRPSMIPQAGDALLETALDQVPTVYGFPTACCWTLADLQDMSAQCEWHVAVVSDSEVAGVPVASRNL